MKIEAENKELILKNNFNNYVIVPTKDRESVLSMIKSNKHSDLDSYIKTLPVASEYAEDGTIVPSKEYALIKSGDGSERKLPLDSPEYKKLYDEKRIGTYDEATDSYTLPPIKEVTISAQKVRNYSGCVEGVCRDLAESNSKSYEDMRKLNNMFGNAWEIGSNSFGRDIYDQKKHEFIPEVKVNDLVVLSRKPFKSDKERGIPESNQHVGRISKIENGVPYVKHYINKDIGYLEEPLEDIKKFTKYTPTKIKRLREFDDNVVPTKGSFKYDNKYSPNTVESDVLKGMNNKEKLQQKLRLTSDEYDNLAKIAYGILGAESDFGRSSRAAYRMVLPDVIQKGVKIAHDKVRGKDIYDDNINNLSQGYGSNKESSQFVVSANDGTRNYKKLNKDIKQGDYDNYNRNTNYIYHAFNALGLDPDKLEDGEKSFYAVIATLSEQIKRNPDAPIDKLLSKYTGKTGKDLEVYKGRVEKYMNNLNANSEDNIQHSNLDNFYGFVSNAANKTYKSVKDFRSEAMGYLRNMSPLPDNLDQMMYDIIGGEKEFNEHTLDTSTYNALKNIVKENVSKGKMTIEYGDYKTSANKNDDVGKKSTSISKMWGDDNYILKTILGQSNIIDKGNGVYEVQDQYNFNDKGKSFGAIDDIQKRGFSPYQIVRALSRNYGSREKQGSKVRIRINLNE